MIRTILCSCLIIGYTFEECKAIVIRDYINQSFSSHHFTSKGGLEVGYRLFTPSSRSDDEDLPLIVWLHGYGEGGLDNTIQLTWLDRIFVSPQFTKEARFFVLAVQCPPENRKWFHQHGVRLTKDNSTIVGEEMCDITASLVNVLIDSHPIDKNRVYATGVSSGGAGCWEIAMRYPDIFAAIMPFSSSRIDRLRLSRLTNVPVWTFNNRTDPNSIAKKVRAEIDVLNELGGKAHLTIGEGGDHDSWTFGFRDMDALDWLLDQNKSIPRSRTPAFYSVRFRAERAWAQCGVSGLAIGVTVVCLISSLINYRRSMRR